MSRTTTNLGLTAVTNSETIGDFSDAMNASGGNLDIIDGKMGAVGNISLQAQINTLNSKFVTEKYTLGSNITYQANEMVDISFAVAKTGYTPIGILEWNLNDRAIADKISFSGMTFASNVAHLYGKAISGCTVLSSAYIVVLFVKS